MEAVAMPSMQPVRDPAGEASGQNSPVCKRSGSSVGLLNGKLSPTKTSAKERKTAKI